MKVVDFHCDTISAIMSQDNKTNLKKNEMCVDIEKLRKGNYMAQFFAMFIDMKNCMDPLKSCLDMIERFYLELKDNKDDIKIARNYQEMVRNHIDGKISAFLTIEEGGAIEGSISNLRNFYRLGVRLMTLTWNFPNEIGYPNCEKEFANKGLTPFGEEVIYEMNNLGMIIDVSHLSDGGFYDTARLSKVPFVASHSNSRTIKNHSRNLSDEMIKILSQKGGLMGINFAADFLGDREMSSIQDMVSHIKHIRNVGGIDVIALGTDFDGINLNLEIENAGQIDKLISELQKAGFNEDEIEKILCKNALRVIKNTIFDINTSTTEYLYN